MNLIGGHKNRSTSIGKLVRYIHLLQGRNDGPAVTVGYIAEQHFVVGNLTPHPAACQQCDNGRNSQHQAHLLLTGHPRQKTLRESLNSARCDGFGNYRHGVSSDSIWIE